MDKKQIQDKPGSILPELHRLADQAFPDETSRDVFLEWVRINGDIVPEFISRRAFIWLAGNVLRENDSEVQSGRYRLFLPQDVSISELPAIIARINRLTFGERLPDFAASNEIRKSIIRAVDALFRVLKTRPDDADTKKALAKYVRLYAEIFGDEEAAELSHPDFRAKSLKDAKGERYSTLRQRAARLATREKLSELKDDLSGLEQDLSKNIVREFYESFFEHAVDRLRFSMETLSKAEMTVMRERQSTLDQSEKETINFRREDVDEQSRKLRDAIGIDRLHAELADVRRSGSTEEVQKLERKATEAILSELKRYPYVATVEQRGYQPDAVLRTKEIYCVGFSLLGHAFLSELGISHRAITIPQHSALAVRIGKDDYYFDGTEPASQGLSKITWIIRPGKEPLFRYASQGFLLTEIGYPGDPELLLQSSIFLNRWATYLRSLNGLRNSVAMYESSLARNPKNRELEGEWRKYRDILARREQEQRAYDDIARQDREWKENELSKSFWEIDRLFAENRFQETFDLLSEKIRFSDAFLADPRAWAKGAEVLERIGRPKDAHIYRAVSEILSGNVDSLGIFSESERERMPELARLGSWAIWWGDEGLWEFVEKRMVGQ